MTLEELQDIFEQYQKANYPKQDTQCAREAVMVFYVEMLNAYGDKSRQSIRRGLANQYTFDAIKHFHCMKMITELRKIWDEYRPHLEGKGFEEQKHID